MLGVNSHEPFGRKGCVITGRRHHQTCAAGKAIRRSARLQLIDRQLQRIAFEDLTSCAFLGNLLGYYRVGALKNCPSDLGVERNHVLSSSRQHPSAVPRRDKGDIVFYPVVTALLTWCRHLWWKDKKKKKRGIRSLGIDRPLRTEVPRDTSYLSGHMLHNRIWLKRKGTEFLSLLSLLK